MFFGNEAYHIRVKDAQTVHIAFGRMAAHKLLAYADAKHGLGKRTDNLVQTPFAQILHGVAGFALTGEYNLVGLVQNLRIVSQYGFHAQSLKNAQNRINIAGIILNYSYCHFNLNFWAQRYAFF